MLKDDDLMGRAGTRLASFGSICREGTRRQLHLQQACNTELFIFRTTPRRESKIIATTHAARCYLDVPWLLPVDPDAFPHRLEVRLFTSLVPDPVEQVPGHIDGREGLILNGSVSAMNGLSS